VKIGIYDPYLDTLGGGEKYIFSIAKCLTRNNDVFVFWNPHKEIDIKKGAKNRFDIDLSRVKFTANIFDKKNSSIDKALQTRKFDIILYLSDGSFPFLFGKKNILLFQFPVNWVNGKASLTKLKLKKISNVICYSYFVKGYLDKTFSINTQVLPPSVEKTNFQTSEKENIILTVGRFTKGLNIKKHDILIDIFKEMYKKYLNKWKFVVIGAALPNDLPYVKKLRNKTKNYPIKILENASVDKIKNYYKKAKIYWHATGFGENLEKHPEFAEHFGISTVEAMGAGAVPVVFNAGGQREIVVNEENGFLWNTIDELKEETKLLINNGSLWRRMSEKATERAEDFAGDRFCRDLSRILDL